MEAGQPRVNWGKGRSSRSEVHDEQEKTRGQDLFPAKGLVVNQKTEIVRRNEGAFQHER